MEIPVVAGIALADVVLTVVIVVLTYQCAVHRQRKTQNDCESCYLLTLSSVIAVIAADIFLTVLIGVFVLYSGALLKRRRDADSQNAGNRSSKKAPAEDTESPYQELQGVQADVYSELQR
ncbi:TYRO protein tyrosine kinase-binding protein [Synchiropus splendidus]|uniref:TYRO protein tyrosine kinase-binding protein n=1 Tax=Synchiropus splendidus TaxID=270530 RepID=UPI00237D7458|nr:TYRO protein tyrosine kinase-binding protein [Synchiropus splendidus]